MAWVLVLACCGGFAPGRMSAQVAVTAVPVDAEALSEDEEQPQTWFDAMQQRLHGLVWRSARMIDGLAGERAPEEVYQQASGSVALALLWDEFNGFDPRVRFRVDLPLPQINERLHLFIGRVNRDEFVTERHEPSGAFPRLRSGASEEDQTLAGLIYTRPERHGGTFTAGAGARVRSSELDPYLKVAYQYRRTLWGDTLFTVKETLFYQMSEQFGLTTRVDFERLLGEFWRLRLTGSATVSEGTDGVRGYSTVTATRSLPGRRALIFRVGLEEGHEPEAPLDEFGVKVAYRTSLVRDWFVLELRTSLTWPKDLPEQPREPSWGFGVGCEVFFGTNAFSSRPVTF